MNGVNWKGIGSWVAGVLVLMIGAAGMLLRPGVSEPTSGGIRAAAALLVVLGITFLGVHWVKHWAKKAGHLRPGLSVGIEILGIKGLGNGRTLMVVEVGGERLLLGAGRDTIVCLARLSGQGNVRPGGLAAEKGHDAC